MGIYSHAGKNLIGPTGVFEKMIKNTVNKNAYSAWAWQAFGLTELDASYLKTFSEAFQQAMSDTNHAHFNLDFVELNKAVTQKSTTSWEFM